MLQRKLRNRLDGSPETNTPGTPSQCTVCKGIWDAGCCDRMALVLLPARAHVDFPGVVKLHNVTKARLRVLHIQFQDVTPRRQRIVNHADGLQPNEWGITRYYRVKVTLGKKL